MPGTSGHCWVYVCPPTPCLTYRRELTTRGEAGCSLTNRRVSVRRWHGADSRFPVLTDADGVNMLRRTRNIFWHRLKPAALLNPHPHPMTIIRCQPAALIILDRSSLFQFLVCFSHRLFSTVRCLPWCWLWKYVGVQMQIFPKALASIDATKIGNSCRSKFMYNFVLKLK